MTQTDNGVLCPSVCPSELDRKTHQSHQIISPLQIQAKMLLIAGLEGGRVDWAARVRTKFVLPDSVKIKKNKPRKSHIVCPYHTES